MSNNDELTRRSFLKGALAFGALVPFGGILAACSAQTEQPASDSAPSQNQDIQEPSSDPAPTSASGAGSVLVAYYSAQGHTRAVAEAIADRLDADLFEVTPVEPYTDEDLNWTDENSRVTREHEDESLRDVALTATEVENWDSYDTVFIGYPIWWGIAAWPVDGFVEANDFTGTTVIPFCTSSSSGLGESGSRLAELAGAGDWLEGQRFSSGATQVDVEAWVDGLGL